MIPSKLDLTIWRGTTFELELVTQVKKYTFDPAIHNSPADLKRTHLENLAHYGFVYEYVDFATLYAGATLEIFKPWRNMDPRDPLLTLTVASGHIQLTARSVKIGLSVAETKDLKFSAGNYELMLTTVAGKVDGFTQGTVAVKSIEQP